MPVPHRRPSRSCHRGPAPRRPRATRGYRPAPLGSTPPAHRHREAQQPTAAAGLTAGLVVRSGDVVGLDDSASVRGLVHQIVGAGPSLVGTSSLDTMVLLSTTSPARTGAVRVRLFGGDHHGGGAFGGARALHAVTHTACDVALVSARIVGEEVWVPAHARDGRLGLLLAAGRTYLVPDETPPTDHEAAPAWVRLAAVDDFAGVLTAPPPAGTAPTTRAA